MGLIQSSRAGSSGGGGGGLIINGWDVYQLEQTTDFIAGEVVLTLPNPMVDVNSAVVTYNGQVLLLNDGYTVLNTSNIQIEFADPYVTTYDAPPVFQVIYPF